MDEIEDEEERLAAAESAGDDKDASDDSDDGFQGFKFPGGSSKDKLAKVAAKRAEAEAKYVQAVAAALPKHKRGRLSKLLSEVLLRISRWYM